MTARADLLYEITWNDNIKAWEYRLLPGQELEDEERDEPKTTKIS